MSAANWFQDFERDARERHDTERLRLIQYGYQGYQLREKDPDQAFLLFSEARQLALRLGEPWMALFYDERRVTALLHFKRDYRNVLDLAVQAALEVRKPQYATYPDRFSIFDGLIAAYLGIDPAGYADAVRQAMDYLDQEVPREPDSHRYLLLARRRIFCLELDRFDEAFEWAMKEMALADGDRDRHRADHFLVFVYCALCQIAAARADWDNLADWSETGDAVTRRVGHQVELAELLAWRAAVTRKQGEEDKALRLARSAGSRQKAQRMPPSRGFYEGLCLYHELGGDLANMLAVRDRELKDVSGWGRLLSEARCRVNRCQLLRRMGQPLETELAAAREAVSKLREPAPLLAQLD
ncbi:MAG TPA: hypothetical protein VKA46_33600 [Gemmataceae bacterium]|nr:hypothetical protein [Gemmataceae bacterium]